jgi:extracellular matrix protein 14
MRPPLLAILPLLTLSPYLVTAAPHQEVHRIDTPDLVPEDSWTWRTVANDIFRRIWPVAQVERSFEAEWEEVDAAVSADEKRVSAGYGGEMVVRFHLKTHEEAQALATASQRLFLDVWEMNDDWVDILLTEKVVSTGWSTQLRSSY